MSSQSRTDMNTVIATIHVSLCTGMYLSVKIVSISLSRADFEEKNFPIFTVYMYEYFMN